MSKYTTMVKSICEEKFIYRPNPAAPDLICPAELTPYLKKYTDTNGDYYKIEHSVGARGVDCVLAYSWDKIFKTIPPEGFFNNTHYPVICRKILKHYYMREIACETAGIWMLWMNERMENIAPYYGALYESADFEFDPFKDTNLTRHHTLDNIGASTQDDIGHSTQADTTAGTQNDTGNVTQNDTGHGTQHDITHATQDDRGHETQDDTTHGTQNDTTHNIQDDISHTTQNDTGNNTQSDTSHGTQDDSGRGEQTDEGHENGTSTTSSNGTSLHADTPQGSISSPIFNSYLTDARKDTNQSTTTTDTDNTYHSIKVNTFGSTKNGTFHSDKDTTFNSNIDNTLHSEKNGTYESDKNNTYNSEKNNEYHSLKGETYDSEKDNTYSSIKNNTYGSNRNITYNSIKDNTLNSEKNYTDNRVFHETLTGKRGFKTYSEMLLEYRKTILNIDKAIINEFKDLFFLLW